LTFTEKKTSSTCSTYDLEEQCSVVRVNK